VNWLKNDVFYFLVSFDFSVRWWCSFIFKTYPNFNEVWPCVKFLGEGWPCE
jgi:hypothetical protein